MILENIPKMVGMIYAIIALFILAYLFHKDKFSRKIRYLFLILSTLMGFLVFAPMFPIQLQLILLGEVGLLGAPLGIALVALVLFILFTILFGRIFCGYLCPIGVIQELLYLLPTPKKNITSKKYIIIFRIIFFLFFVSLASLFSINTLYYLGIASFFNLKISSIFSIVFVILLLISISVYRPFCRLFCPYGVFLSLAARISIIKLRRNSDCIDCGKCEEVCPTNEADRDDLKQECYMCNRCKDVCPVDTIEYKWRNEK